MSAYSIPFDGIDLQKSIDAVTDWTKDWLMKLNLGKFKVIHLVKNNVQTDFEIEDLSTGQRRLLDKPISE